MEPITGTAFAATYFIGKGLQWMWQDGGVYDVAKDLRKDFLKWLGGRAGAAKIYNAVRNRLLRGEAPGVPPPNHDVQRAVRRAMLRATLAFSVFRQIELAYASLASSPWQLQIDAWLGERIKETNQSSRTPPRSRSDGRADALLREEAVALDWLLSEMFAELLEASKPPASLPAWDPEFAVFVRRGWVPRPPPHHLLRKLQVGSASEGDWQHNLRGTNTAVTWSAAACEFFLAEYKTTPVLRSLIDARLLLDLKYGADQRVTDAADIAFATDFASQVQHALRDQWQLHAAAYTRLDAQLADIIDACTRNTQKLDSLHQKVDRSLANQDLSLANDELIKRLLQDILRQSAATTTTKDYPSPEARYLEALRIVAESNNLSADDLLAAIAGWRSRVTKDPTSAHYDLALAALAESHFVAAANIASETARRVRDVRRTAASEEYNAWALAAQASRAANRPTDALAAYRNALGAISELESPLAAASAKKDCAHVLENLGRYTEAEALFQQVLTTFEKYYGRNHRDVAAVLNHLGEIRRSTGRFAAAEMLHNEAFTIYNDLLPFNSPEIAWTLGSAALAMGDAGRFEEAKQLQELVVGICQSVYGADHPTTALHKVELGFSHYRLGDTAQAKPLFRDALDVLRIMECPDANAIAYAATHLAFIYEDSNQLGEAETLYHEAVQLREAALGPEAPALAISLNNLSRIYCRRGKFHEAMVLCKRALGIYFRIREREGLSFRLEPGALHTFHQIVGAIGWTEKQEAEALQELRADAKITAMEVPDAKVEDAAS